MFNRIIVLLVSTAFFLSQAQASEEKDVVESENLSAVQLDEVDVQADDDDEYLEDNEVDEDMIVRPRISTLLSGAKNYADHDLPDDGIKQLDKVARLDLRTQEQIMLWNTYAYVYFISGDAEKTAHAYEQQLQFDKIDEDLKKTTLSSLAQLKMQEQDYQGSLNYLNQWFELTDEPSPDIYLFKAQLQYELGQYSDAVASVDEAIKVRDMQAKAAGKAIEPVPEKWMLIKRSVYYKAQDYQGLERILKQLIMTYPKTEYWTQLSAVYNQLGRGEKELASMEAVYLQDGFTKENELIGYAQILMANDLSYEAATVLEDSIKAGKVEATDKNYAMLSDAWLIAKEYDFAMRDLEVASSKSKKGDFYTRLAQIQLDQKDYQGAIESVEKAVVKPTKDSGMARLIQGMAYYNLEQYDEAKAAFTQASEYKKTAKNAEQWIKQVDDLLARKAEISEYINQ